MNEQPAPAQASSPKPQKPSVGREESALEKRNTKLFVLGLVVTILYIGATIGVFFLYINMNSLFSPR